MSSLVRLNPVQSTFYLDSYLMIRSLAFAFFNASLFGTSHDRKNIVGLPIISTRSPLYRNNVLFPERGNIAYTTLPHVPIIFCIEYVVITMKSVLIVKSLSAATSCTITICITFSSFYLLFL